MAWTMDDQLIWENADFALKQLFRAHLISEAHWKQIRELIQEDVDLKAHIKGVQK